MLRSTLGKVAWVGRTASMVFGLALVMALVFGVASMAFAANGQNFILGSLNNAATAMTKLTGNVAGKPALQIVNPNTGAGSHALQLITAPGKPPLVVNATAGKAVNLNADKVDGQDSTALLPGGDLPSGRTLRGSYSIYDTASRSSYGQSTTAISFGYRLASPPTVRIIKKGATPPAECPGTVSSPEANPGYLCVYEANASNLYSSAFPSLSTYTRNGAILYARSAYNGSTTYTTWFETFGTWAVTGN